MKGNPVMKAKRVTGPTPNAELILACKLARCSKCGEQGTVLRTIPNPTGVVRVCGPCLVGKGDTKASIITSKGWVPAWFR